MPKGGYCEVDGRWVWIQPDGSCQFGHPANRVREVQELIPLSPRGRPISTPVRLGLVPHKQRHWFRYSGWLLLTLTWGLLNWLAFIYIGLRARRALWVGWGFVYLVPLALFIASFGIGYVWYALAFQLFVAVVSLVHGLALRPRYRSIMFGDPPPDSVPSPPQLPAPRMWAGLDRGLEDNVAQTLREADGTLKRLRDVGNSIVDPEVRQAVGRLSLTGHEILGELSRHPERIEAARGFLTYYLDASLKIAAGYQALAARQNLSPEMRAMMEQARTSLAGIQRPFSAQLATLVERDLLDLDSELALLDKMVEMDDRFDAVRGQPPPGDRQLPPGDLGLPPGAGQLPPPEAPQSPSSGAHETRET